MEFICLDFETAFDREYSLSRMTTESYVRDSRFKAHMVGISINTEPAFVVDPHILKEDHIWRARIQNSMLLCHHAHFDGLILSHHFGLRPKFWFDTLSMARATLRGIKVGGSLAALAKHYGLAEKNVPYDLFRGVRDLPHDIYSQLATGCAHDVDLTVQVFRNLIQDFPREELKVIDQVVRMFTEPTLQLDVLRMQKFLNTTRADKARLLAEAGVTEAQMQSSDLFAEALGRLGYACPMKWSEAQQKEIPALAKSDDGMKELEEHDDPRVQALASARLGSKSTIDETRAQRFLDVASRGALPIYLNYSGAKTHRFSGGDSSNFQNMRRGSELRKCIVAPAGHKLVIADLAQIEYRLLCYVAGQHDKLEALASGRDLYSEIAAQFYGYAVSKALPKERGLGKQITLSCGYGSGASSIQATAGNGGYGPPIILSDAEALAARDLYRRTHPMVQQFWRLCDRFLEALFHKQSMDYGCLKIRNGQVILPNGLTLDYSDLRWARACDIYPDQRDDGEGPCWWESTRKGWSRIWGSKLTADLIQSLARVLIGHYMVIIGRSYRIVLQCHDELVQVVPDALVDTAKVHVDNVMREPPAWCTGIPLAVEVQVSDRYDK